MNEADNQVLARTTARREIPRDPGLGSGSAASWPRSGPGWSRRARLRPSRRPRSRRRDRPRARRRLHRDAVTEAVIFALAVLLAIGLGVVLVRISGRPAAQAPAAG